MKDIHIFDNYPDVVSVKQLREMLGIGKNTAYTLISENRIKHIRVGKQIKIAKSSIITFLLDDPADIES